MKIKEQTRKLVVGCSKYSFEVADKTDEVGNIRDTTHIYTARQKLRGLKRFSKSIRRKRMKEIAFDAFYQLYQNDQLSLVDVREVDEFAALHLEGAHNLPLSQLADSYD
ncbi:rhodanese-related sulfurtransferase [Streptococcus pneumoniae]|nr:rhodanese-related sulfurtransferase [Streptococcus pneumoniae]